MKKTLFLSFIAASLSFTACNDELLDVTPDAPQIPEIEVSRATFPADDGTKEVPGSTPNEKVKNLLQKVNAQEVTDTLGRAIINTQQYAEIKAFTDELVKGSTKQYDAFMKCYQWVSTNVKYATGYVDNNPYAVFKSKSAICQGYANLLFIMLHSQGIPALVCNGILNPVGGHAWNYVCCDGVWWVADPTNPGVGGPWGCKMHTNYAHLIPMSLDIVLFKENDCWFDYSNTSLNICNITSKESSFTVPYSVSGYMVTSFNPLTEISSSIKELYIGKNIKSLGENPIGLSVYAPNLEYVHIDPANTSFISYLGTVYRKNDGDYELAMIPGGMKCVELMPMETIYKNTIYDHKSVEVLVVAPGTKSIKAWGIEKCPNLKIAYVPEDVEVDKNAFYNVHPDFQIIRGDYTNIPEVRE